MKAGDVMTSPVVSIGPDAPLRQVAALLSERRITGVPVLEGDRLVGLVTEADLLRRRRSGSLAGRARDVMTHEVMTVAADTPVAKVAALLEGYGIKRVPVVQAGRLVGIVSRSNLVQALAVEDPAGEPVSDDDTIRRALLSRLAQQPSWGADSNLIVTDGVVHLWGPLRSEDEREAARAAAHTVSGVRRVEDHRFAAREHLAAARPATGIRRASARGHSRHGWVDSWHSFSFGNYYDPAHVGYGPLRVINENLLQPGKASATYGLRHADVLAYVLEGVLGHEDSMGNSTTLPAGGVQCFSAGSGARFSEFNCSQSQPCRFLQIWMEADPAGQASFACAQTSPDARRGRLQLIASPDGRQESLRMNQDALLYAGLFDGDERAHLDLARGRLAYVHVARGAITANGEALEAGDGLASRGTSIALQAARDAEVMVFDLPERPMGAGY